jgi:hypothetical protein
MRHSPPETMFPTLAALRAAEYQHRAGAVAEGPSVRGATPFVTISRQAGAGGRSFVRALVARLNERDPGDLPWTAWDNELVERVAAEHHLPVSRVAALEDASPSWLEDALGGLAVAAAPADKPTVFRRVAATIRALAELGRVVIVGRGSAFVTGDLPGGTHVRLVAPLERRVERATRSMGCSPEMAAEWVRDTDAARAAFYRRHFPGRTLAPEGFAATFNTAAALAGQLVESALALVPVAATAGIQAAPSPSTAR